MNEEAYIISCLFNGIGIAELKKRGINSKLFNVYKDELKFLEKNGVPSKGVFKAKFPSFKMLKVDQRDFPIIVSEFFDKKSKFKIFKGLESLTESFDTKNSITIAEELKKLSQSVIDTKSSDEIPNIIENWQPVFSTVKERKELSKTNATIGIPTGFPTLDKMFGGLQKGELIVVIGFQSEGKSWVLSKLCSSAIMDNKKVMFVSLEMQSHRLAYRIHTVLNAGLRKSKSDFTNSALELGRGLSLKKYKNFLKKIKRNYRNGLFIPERKNIGSMSDVYGIAANIKPDIIFYDYLGVNFNDTDSSQSWEQLGNEAATAKAIAMEYDIPVVVAVQANRPPNQQKKVDDSAPGLSRIARSFLIGAHADRAIGLKLVDTHLTIGVAKNRYGDDSTIRCEWDPDHGVIEERKIINRNKD